MTIEWFGSNVDNRWRKSVKKFLYLRISHVVF